MKKIILFLSAFLLVLWVVPSPVFSLYKWRDKEGVIHITDFPPATGPYETVGDQNQPTEGKTPPVQVNTVPKKEKAPTQGTSGRDSKSIYVPLRRAGNHFLAEMKLNGQADGYFLLDTGASMTVINPQIAEKAGIILDDSLPILPLKTASGLIFPPVAHVDEFSLGKLTLIGGDVVVYDIRFGKGASGLLGMDILSDYMVTLDTQKATLVLKPVKKAGPIYGGHPRKWWRSRFGFYRHILHSLQSMGNVPDKALKPYHITKERVEKSMTIYQERLDELKSLAEDDLVPLEWRE